MYAILPYGHFFQWHSSVLRIWIQQVEIHDWSSLRHVVTRFARKREQHLETPAVTQ